MERIAIPTQIYSGTDSLKQLGKLNQEHILMVCDAFLPGTPTLDEIKGNINSSNQVTVFSDVKPDPPLKNIMQGVNEYLKNVPTVMIGIGGGSAIDTGKAIRFFGEKLSGKCIKEFIAIPTTSGTGSEVTNTAVISDPENHQKFPIMEDYLIPDIALLDPQLVMTAPNSVTAFSGLDVLTHALEAVVAQDANTITDALAEKSASVIINNLVECYQHGDNEAARKIVHEASCAAGAAFNNAGLGICHSIAHQLGANFHIPHGLANAMLLPYVVEYNATHSQLALHKYAMVARKAGLASSGMGDRVAVRKLQSQIKQMARKMNCPATLTAFGIDTKAALEATDQIVASAKLDGTFPGNPVVPTDEDLAEIYKKIIK
ncbi:1-propanol dehydrogenase PduQ [Pediococcus acidilactici]|uniref:1-propanol dehydrogenase PduQ n=1 Tax=Pediococcus acidilactici TaxID=1254 RepID=UPI000FFE2E35|nr:1-propanol dehydrogenase PduQ [Pediococcus acidilactici]KAF0363588.1 iron-containing alcohol dehydrogenase [Pediococcus acidilactici]KAF0367344.1 iron-containing alcohol dehydrogenase [Pediococcus acidilactici]KAF0417889.1 iron-containing alcohol dehydrogenase [Pediococcus acidilactici]KAF0421177.1 iron-containing alcohol dehydrogenase [Pediococcus acidilactici]KAF0473846.1 iron-containing alcohol dehydrogenase [Pediococcus acidilactici]